ncbi:transglutaminase superfamily protein [Mucilaginibacter frigoritolerans]|uniref:Transglutaminase superfamily protein n=1 Tax=Mucilaginibacter frigoritolerans TaxID=652788 RepID=A0A562TM32_9SPHI|nr:transglutaminase domain-containing protein [Mucilaginibacter frigoritolerans]TWI93900.1 transglutaminase superfamily protein [Mucilaginibacter frigoritolerans]
MKKTLLICFISLFALMTNAQQKQETEAFNNYVMVTGKNIEDSYQAKNYTKAIDLSNDWLNTYHKQSTVIQKNYQGNTINIYYNLGCYTALSGQKADAINWLKKAFDAGFIDYNSIIVDGDLVSLHNEPEFKTIVQQIREKGDYLYILKNSGPYNIEQNAALPVFSYQSASTPELVNFKQKFNLDSVAGSGDEISKFKNLLFWAHNIVRHDGSSGNPPNKNAIDLIAVCKKDDRGVNCRMMATILKDAYQAEGFKARLVTCMPKDTADFDCHVITVVWSKTLNKWIWMDPTFNAYVSDEKGNLLNIEEVRERMINDQPWSLNADANWNNKSKETKQDYFHYMSKNLYWLKCAIKSDWDLETRSDNKPPIEYINLYPGSFTTIHQSKKTQKGMIEYASNNPSYFWQKPAEK